MVQEVCLNTLEKNDKLEWKGMEDVRENHMGILELKYMINKINNLWMCSITE